MLHRIKELFQKNNYFLLYLFNKINWVNLHLFIIQLLTQNQAYEVTCLFILILDGPLTSVVSTLTFTHYYLKHGVRYRRFVRVNRGGDSPL